MNKQIIKVRIFALDSGIECYEAHSLGLVIGRGTTKEDAFGAFVEGSKEYLSSLNSEAIEFRIKIGSRWACVVISPTLVRHYKFSIGQFARELMEEGLRDG